MSEINSTCITEKWFKAYEHHKENGDVLTEEQERSIDQHLGDCVSCRVKYKIQEVDFCQGRKNIAEELENVKKRVNDVLISILLNKEISDAEAKKSLKSWVSGFDGPGREETGKILLDHIDNVWKD